MRPSPSSTTPGSQSGRSRRADAEVADFTGNRGLLRLLTGARRLPDPRGRPLEPGLAPHPVGHLAASTDSPRPSGAGTGGVNARRAPLGSDEVGIVELAVVIRCPGLENGEARLHGQQVAQPRTGTVEGHTVSVHHILANLRAQTELELPAGSFLELPRRGCRDEGTARDANAIPVDSSRPGAAGEATVAFEIDGAAVFGEQRTLRPGRRARSPSWLSGCGIIIASTRTAQLYARAPLIWAVVLRHPRFGELRACSVAWHLPTRGGAAR